MDKNNKNRTDLLAAGRKRLQQFRQKKDGKGGKSSGKSSKPGRDADSDAAKSASTSDKLLDEEMSVSDDVEVVTSSELHPLKGSVVVDDNVIIDLSSKDAAGETTSELTDEILGLEDSGRENNRDKEVSEILVPLEGGSVSDHRQDVELVDSRSLGILVSDEKSTPSAMQVPVDLSSEVEQMVEEQEASSAVSKQTVPGSETWTERVVPDAVACEADRSNQPGDVGSPKVRDEQINDVSGSSNDHAQVDNSYKQDAAEVLLGFEDDGLETSFRNNLQKLPSGTDACSISLSQLEEVMKGVDNDQFRFLFCSRESLHEKLTNSLGLSGPEFYNFVEKLKEELYLSSFARDASQMQLCEQLELEMQLRHQFENLVGELSVSGATVREAEGKNAIVSEELKQCRSDCQEFCSEGEKLRKQLHASKAEAEKFSAKVDDLQNRLEISGSNMSGLASELADCRNLVASLQVQNENLNGKLSLVMEEKMKVVEEKENFLQDNDKMTAELAQSKASFASLQLENVNLSECLATVHEEKRKSDDEKENLACENDKLLSYLSDSNALVQSLQSENASLSELVTALMEEKRKLHLAQERFVQENEKLALGIVDSRILVDSLQMELSYITGSLASLMEEKNNVKEEKQCLSIKNESASELDSGGVLAALQMEFSKFVRDLEKANLHIEKLSQENVLLRRNLELHIAKMSSYGDTANELKDTGGQIIVGDDTSSQFPRTEESETAISEGTLYGSLPKNIVMDDPNVSSGSEFWKMHVEANGILQKLEKAIEGMYSVSASLSSSSGKHAQSGVSKLIQAFETKTHSDECEVDEVPLSGSADSGDLYVQAKEQTKHLQVLLKQLLLLAESVSKSLEVERGSRISADLLNTQLEGSCEFFKSHCNQFEEENIELVVLCEALKQHICNSKTGVAELITLSMALQEQEVTIEAENIELKDKLSSLEANISEFQSRLDEICRSSDEMISSIFNRVEVLQKEVGDRGLIIDKEWKSFVDQIIVEVGKLDNSIETFSSFTLSNDHQKSLDVGSRIAASVNSATKVIEELHRQLKGTQGDHQAILSTHSNLNMEFRDLQEKNELAIEVLGKIYRNLRRVVESCGHAEGTTGLNNVNLLDPGLFNNLLEHLENMLDEKLQLKSDNDMLTSHMVDQASEIDDLKRRCSHLDAILELFENLHEEFLFGSFNVNIADPVPGFESFVSILVQKYKEAKEQVSQFQEILDLNEQQLGYFQEELDHLTFILVQYENENLVLKESWKTVKEDIPALQAQLQERVSELEQSEHRVSSLREKLSIAVTKGKGLIVQRDNLKQSLAETSNLLEKYSQDLQLKDIMVHELETKLQNYSEAGERMEALKSELAYIRNSATALRESFLLKDSILQRIEEILEDLELPELFHSRDVIEKVDWLAKSVTGNTAPHSDWDQKNSVEASHSESGFAGVDGWKEESQSNQDLADDFRRRYEELEGKFYGLAEHNEMLEQSLIERNSLVQRLEEIIGKIEIPLQLRSMEPEDRIQWLGGTLLDTQDQCNSLQHRIDYLDALNGSLTGDLEKSESRISELESAYHSIVVEKECLLKNLESVNNDYRESSKTTSQLEMENEKLLEQVICLQEKLDQKLVDEEHLNHVEVELRRLQDLIRNVLQDSVTDDSEFASNNMEYLEHLLRKVLDKYSALLAGNLVADGHANEEASVTLHEEKTRDSGVTEEDVEALSKKLEDTLGEVRHLKEERDGYLEKNQSLIAKIEALAAKSKEMEELLNLEVQKSATLREKLNMAVKKGKSLVQQRDNLKLIIDESNAEVDRLKFEVSQRENSITEYEQRVMNLSSGHERIKDVEAECVSLRDQLVDSEHCLHEKEHMLSLILESLKVIDVDFDTGNPVEKLEAIRKKFIDLNAALDSSLQESRKSKRAAELLLTELNEVQERNDALQEDLGKVTRELSEIYREKELSEAAKFEALARIEKLSAIQSEEKDHLLTEVSMLRSSMDQMREEISTVNSSLAGVLSKDLEIMQHLEAGIKSCLECAPSMDAGSAIGDFDSIDFPKSQSKASVGEIGFIKELLQRHHNSVQEQASHTFEVVKGLYTEVSSLKESFDYRERNLHQIKSILKDKDSELVVARRNVSLLFEACTISTMEIENWKSQQDGIGLSVKAPWVDLNSEPSEEVIVSVREKLLSVVKDLISKQNEVLQDRQMEWKTIVSNLQKELHEKDIQRERICAELVSQIKDAEVRGKNCLQDLRSAMTKADDLQSQVDVMEEEHSLLAKRVKELEYQETLSAELQQRVASMTDTLAGKDQEIEALMQALDEEESQMEGLSNKILELENDLQKKIQNLENLEASRGKILKKLSVTVSKFDELHHLSETLLSEVEKLQSQLQERDGEISFLRQEITRCTNEALTATQMSNKRNSDEVLELLTWLDKTVSRVEVPDMPSSDAEAKQVGEHKELLQKQIDSIVSELEELRTVAQNRELLLKAERIRIEELIRKEEFLENSLLEKDSQLTMLRRVGDSVQATSPKSEIVEVEPLINKRAAPGSIATQVRGGRKTNSDQVAIAIDMDPVSGMEDDDDDKAHGFKSLTTSRIVPRFTRPVSDMIDGLWMSCDRTLMRQPTLRLGVILYWAIIHSLLATFVV